jgi:AmmeMemoRadiSam system protein A
VPLTPAQRILLLTIARAGLLEKLGSGVSRDIRKGDATPDSAAGATSVARSPVPQDAQTCDADVEVVADEPDAADAADATATDAADDAVAAPTTDPSLTTPAGCFVSLHEKETHRLRGCVGRLDPEMPLWRVVRETAGDVLRDPRFTDMPVTAADLPILELEISVLSPPHQAKDPLDFDPLSDGIYLIHGNRSGFFLPQVARETRWSKHQLLSRLCEEKLGLPHDTWRKPEAKLFTFKVEVIGPEAV